jgi:hypothetical protein
LGILGFPKGKDYKASANKRLKALAAFQPFYNSPEKQAFRQLASSRPRNTTGQACPLFDQQQPRAPCTVIFTISSVRRCLGRAQRRVVGANFGGEDLKLERKKKSKKE